MKTYSTNCMKVPATKLYLLVLFLILFNTSFKEHTKFQMKAYSSKYKQHEFTMHKIYLVPLFLILFRTPQFQIKAYGTNCVKVPCTNWFKLA
jgi:hypothetical protein